MNTRYVIRFECHDLQDKTCARDYDGKFRCIVDPSRIDQGDSQIVEKLAKDALGAERWVPVVAGSRLWTLIMVRLCSGEFKIGPVISNVGQPSTYFLDLGILAS